MTFATSSPAASTAGQGNTPPICQNCTTSTTPLWRRDEAGSVLCNACGLFLKLHGRPRPPALKTDVIKSRNRVKNSGAAKKKSLFDNPPAVAPAPAPTSNSGHHTPRSEAGTPPPSHSYPSLHQYHHSHSRFQHARSVSPQSRAGTPTLPPPSSIFDPQLLTNSPRISTDPHYHSQTPPPTLPALNLLTQPSPPSLTRHTSAPAGSPPPSIDPLVSENNRLKTRVSELELVNDLFRGRVSELERAEQARKEVETQLRAAIDEGRRREEELRRRVEDMERMLEGARKRRRDDVEEQGTEQRAEREERSRGRRVRVEDITQ